MLPPIPILLYHRVAEHGGPYTTSPELFDRHLAWLADRGFRALTASELAPVVAGRRPAPREPVVALTFDDGYAELDTEVAPRLRHYGMRGTAFLITERCPEARTGDEEYLAWPEARSLATEGVLELHSHTHSHTRWDLDPAQASVVVDDVATARTVLAERLGEPESAFGQLAWPWGRTCPTWEDGVAALGITTQYGVQHGVVLRPGQPRRLPRHLADGTPLPVLARWMSVLTNRVGGPVTNHLFHTLRRLRGEVGYR